MKKRTKQERYFAACINNKKYEASLEVGKLIGSFLTMRRNHTGIYAWLMKVVRTTDIRRAASFASKCRDHWSELFRDSS